MIRQRFLSPRAASMRRSWSRTGPYARHATSRLQGIGMDILLLRMSNARRIAASVKIDSFLVARAGPSVSMWRAPSGKSRSRSRTFDIRRCADWSAEPRQRARRHGASHASGADSTWSGDRNPPSAREDEPGESHFQFHQNPPCSTEPPRPQTVRRRNGLRE